MNTMTRWTMAGALALAGALDSAPAEAAAYNPYSGTWCGTFERVGDEDPAIVGTVEWTITDAGQVTGSFYNTTHDVWGTMVGHIDNDGTLQLNQNLYGPGPGGGGGNGAHHSGQAYIDDDGILVAPTTGTWSGAYSVLAVLQRCD